MGCTVTGGGIADAADLAMAQAACDRAVDRYSLLFGDQPPVGTLEVTDSVRIFATVHEGAAWRMIWPSSARLRQSLEANPVDGASIDEAVDEQWGTVLPHELGHLMLIADAERRRPDGREARRLADWLHEGVAVFMEPSEYRRDEYLTLRAHRPFVPEIDDLVQFRVAAPEGLAGGSTITRTFYPCASAEACDGRAHWDRSFSVRTRYLADGNVVVDTLFHDAPPPPPTPLASHFYVYSATLVRYVHERGGSAALTTLIQRYVDSEDGNVLLAGLPGLAVTAERIEDDWRRWFELEFFGEAGR